MCLIFAFTSAFRKTHSSQLRPTMKVLRVGCFACCVLFVSVYSDGWCEPTPGVCCYGELNGAIKGNPNNFTTYYLCVNNQAVMYQCSRAERPCFNNATMSCDAEQDVSYCTNRTTTTITDIPTISTTTEVEGDGDTSTITDMPTISTTTVVEGDGDTINELKNCYIGCATAAVVGACGLLIMLLLAGGGLVWRRNRDQAVMLSTREVQEFVRGSGAPVSSKSNQEDSVCVDEYELIQSLPYDSKYEISMSKLHIDRAELLGSGAFGNVYKSYIVLAREGKVLTVAVKTMKPDMDKSHFKSLLAEVKVMTHVAGGQHPNIIRLVGACTRKIRKCQVFLATEFCEKGNLINYLRTLDPKSNFRNLIQDLEGDGDGKQPDGPNAMVVLTTCNLLKWAREIASGMDYLGQRQVVHGDLAARNVLLDSGLIAKISDFGLSKQVQALQQYVNTYVNVNTGAVGLEAQEMMLAPKVDTDNNDGHYPNGGLLPWKWLAPETLAYMKFSVASDVWAYGVTLWEIFTLGQVPYTGTQWSLDFLTHLMHGELRLQMPEYAPLAVYTATLECWTTDPAKRTSFCQVKNVLDRVMASFAADDYLYIRTCD